ncbi:uncharacterized protein LOC109598289 isoform X3 [Aethina tumida]|uniref:uncharacterized protein LOC109598289 isoform X3 n=1 Tax=Aethina tumida TaxID=116153 RepID=UPI002147D6F3|nr:uncharacterized protein LOC109598289 isoform X3 [Aethina tumida]
MCPTTINSTKDMMACFRNASASNLNSNANTLWNEIYTGGDAFNQFPIAPVIEINHPDAFMSESNWVNLKYGYFQRVPVIIGTTCLEGNFLQSTTLAQYSAKTTVACGLTPWDMNINNNITACQVDLILRQKYFTSNTNYTAQVQKFVGDVLFHKATVKAAKLLCPYTMPVFYYRFCFPNTDAGHGSDTPYTFCTASDFANDTASQTTCQTMMSMWANFAKYRNPIYPNDTNPLLNNVSWSPMDNSNCSNLVYLNISITMNTASNPDDEIIQMWDWLYDFYGQLNYTTY